MKKRILSLALAFVMLLSLLPMAALAAEPMVNYVTTANVPDESGKSSGYTNVVKNWGTRGEPATFLSPMAEDFYGSLDYGTLSAYSEDQLQSLMAGNYPIPDYDDAKYLLTYTDCQENGYYLSDFYTGSNIDPTWDGVTWNREHTWPQSKIDAGENTSTVKEDLVMLRPVSSSVNSGRGNAAYGESDGFYHPNAVSTDTDVRGDVARSMIYGYVRWDMANIFGSTGVIENDEILLKWMAADPVDTWEMGRNDSIQSITGTRNVFVDYPELAFIVLGASVPTDMYSPSGNSLKLGYSVTAVSNDESMGSVHVNGNTITAMPKMGYAVSGYTLLSGTANVTQSYDIFTVDGNCCIQINFKHIGACVVNYVHDGVVASTVSSEPGALVYMPEYSGNVPEGHQFAGWITSEVVCSATAPITVMKPGDPYTVVDGPNNIYALYTYMDMSVSSYQWVLVTNQSDLSVGQRVVVVAADYDKAMSTEQKTKNRGAVAVTKNLDGTVTWTGSDVQELVLTEGTVSGTFGLYTGSGYLYSNGSSSNNTLQTGGLAANASWTITVASDGSATVKSNGSNTNNWMRYNASSLFSCYGPTSAQKNINFYRAVQSGKVMYTTAVNGCSHNTTVSVEAVAPTCTDIGYTAGIQCTACLRYIAGYEAIEALGHAYTHTVIAPTYEQQGYTLYSCTRCDHSYKSDYTDPIKNVHTVSFAVPEGVSTIESMECGSSGITLPEAEAPTGYSFAGWTSAPVEQTETAPVFNKAGVIFKTDVDTTLYALYTNTVGGSGSTGYVLTDLADIPANTPVVITMNYEGTVYALTNGNGASAAPKATVVQVSGNKLSAEPAENLQWNITAANGSYTIYPNGTTATWLYCTGTNNGVRVGTNSNKVFTLDASGYLKNTATSRFVGVYLTKPDWRCYTSTTTNIKNQTLGFYVKATGGTTYYTTLDSAVAEKAVFAVYAGSEEVNTYAKLLDALLNYDPSSEYIKLLENAVVDITLDRNVYIDLNGYYLSGTVQTSDYVIYGMDTTTDQYSCEDIGYFSCVDTQGQPIVPEKMVKSSVTGAVKRYLTIETEEGYSFHRFYMGITHANLKPGVKGVGYKATFAGDEMVKACVDSFGYTLQLGGNTPVTASKAGTELEGGQNIVTLRVENYDADRMGTTELSANVFMVIDGEKISGGTVTITLKGLVEQINALNNLDNTQKAALAAWITQSETMQSWNISNIYTPE